MTDFTKADDDDFISQKAEAADTHLLLKVPNYNGATAAADMRDSYLRLGAVDPTVKAYYESWNAVDANTTTTTPNDLDVHLGEDLAKHVRRFVDDDRTRADGATAITARQAESKALHTKGGWRDHSDGNRITTTRGDKVEVIRGNYKLLVLGRQNDPDEAVSYDASGGLIQDGDIAPGAITEIRWVKDPFAGTWRVIEETTKGDIVNRYHGNVDEIFYGDAITTTIGRESPGGTIPGGSAIPRTSADGAEQGSREGWSDEGIGDANVKATNPAIVERTWASSIDAYAGSTTTPVPSIRDYRYAKQIYERVVVSKEDHATLDGKLDSHTTPADGPAEGSYVSHVIADRIEERRVGRYVGQHQGWSTEWWGVGEGDSRFDEIFAGGHASLRMGASVELSGVLAAEVFLGLAFEVFAGIQIAANFGMVVDYRIGPAFDIATSDAHEYKIFKNTVAAIDNKVASIKQSLALMILCG
jgi:hypothetical protein